MVRKLELDYIAIGDRIKERRQALEFTQGTLARQTGMTTSFIGHIERAEKVPSLDTVARLSAALETTMDWLVLGLHHRCEGKDCPLYDDLQGLMRAYGLGEKRNI
jgi:transcriptional regulator with XRE-family HTH domain